METEGMEMEMLETERLELVPLRAELLRMWTEDIPGLEKRLGCSYKADVSYRITCNNGNQRPLINP